MFYDVWNSYAMVLRSYFYGTSKWNYWLWIYLTVV